MRPAHVSCLVQQFPCSLLAVHCWNQPASVHGLSKVCCECGLLLQACIENGTHYCDITAEAQYIQRNLEEFAEPAKEAGVRIVHSCGLDSVPSEVMTLMAAHHMQKRHGAALGEVTYTVDGSARLDTSSPLCARMPVALLLTVQNRSAFGHLRYLSTRSCSDGGLQRRHNRVFCAIHAR